MFFMRLEHSIEVNIIIAIRGDSIFILMVKGIIKVSPAQVKTFGVGFYLPGSYSNLGEKQCCGAVVVW